MSVSLYMPHLPAYSLTINLKTHLWYLLDLYLILLLLPSYRLTFIGASWCAWVAAKESICYDTELIVPSPSREASESSLHVEIPEETSTPGFHRTLIGSHLPTPVLSISLLLEEARDFSQSNALMALRARTRGTLITTILRIVAMWRLILCCRQRIRNDRKFYIGWIECICDLTPVWKSL